MITPGTANSMGVIRRSVSSNEAKTSNFHNPE
jgi:hypothetical protein